MGVTAASMRGNPSRRRGVPVARRSIRKAVHRARTYDPSSVHRCRSGAWDRLSWRCTRRRDHPSALARSARRRSQRRSLVPWRPPYRVRAAGFRVRVITLDGVTGDVGALEAGRAVEVVLKHLALADGATTRAGDAGADVALHESASSSIWTPGTSKPSQ